VWKEMKPYSFVQEGPIVLLAEQTSPSALLERINPSWDKALASLAQLDTCAQILE